MKILVMSDSHRDTSAMLKATALELPELILHLGDNDKDCTSIEWEFPEIPLRSVRGNCDRSSSGLDMAEFTINGKRFYMTHGHMHHVKSGLSSLISFSSRRGAEIVLFGHTHNPHYSVSDNITLINPGSIGMGGKTYAVLDLKNGDIVCDIKRLP